MKKFRGWTVPGPAAAHAVETDLAEFRKTHGLPEEDISCDALSGHFRLFQRVKGHRFSTDDLLVAMMAASYGVRFERILDLGTGLGTVVSVLAWKFPSAQLAAVEAQAESARLARASLEWNGLGERVRFFEGDFREVGLPAEALFDVVTGSPPYFPLGAGVLSDDAQKVACRFEVRGDVSDYARVAAARLAPGGIFAFVFPTAKEARALAGCEAASLRCTRLQRVVFREGRDPLMSLFVCMRAEDLPTDAFPKPAVPPPLCIRDAQGAVTPEYATLKLAIGFPP